MVRAQASEPRDSRANSIRNRFVIGLFLVAAFAVYLNETFMVVALPNLIIDLKVAASTVQWLTTAVMLTMAVVIPLTGFLLQRFNTRPLFVMAMGLFTLGTLIAMVAPGFGLLLVGRIIQGAGTGVMTPLLITTAMTLVAPERRGRMMGYITIVTAVAPALGPGISGIVLHSLNWHWLFIIVFPVALITLVLGIVFLTNLTVPRRIPIDVASVILSALGFGALVYGLSIVGTATAPAQVWVPLLGGVVVISLFVLRQVQLQKADRALLDLRTFRVPTFALGISIYVISSIPYFGLLVLMPIYIQTVLGGDVLTTGLMLLPGGALLGFLGLYAGRLFDRFGPRFILLTATILTSAGLWVLTGLDGHSTLLTVFIEYTALSVGVSLIYTPVFSACLGSLPRDLYAHGSSILSTVEQLGGAIGTALFVSIMSASITGRPAATSALSATAAGIHWAFVAGAVISLFAIPAAFFIGRRTRSPATMPVTVP